VGSKSRSSISVEHLCLYPPMLRRRSISTDPAEATVFILIVLLSIVLICVTWSTCRHIRRQRAAANSCQTLHSSDDLTWSPCIVMVPMTDCKETEFLPSQCVVCGGYHSLAESPVLNHGTNDAEKGNIKNVCVVEPPPPVYAPHIPLVHSIHLTCWASG